MKIRRHMRTHSRAIAGVLLSAIILASPVTDALAQDKAADEGGSPIISRLSVVGVEHIREDILLRDAGIEAGQVFSPRDLAEARQSLIDTGLYDFAEITFGKDPAVENGYWVLIDVVERPRLGLLPLIRRGPEHDFSYGFNVQARNVWGLRHSFHLQSLFGGMTHVELGWRNPWVPGTPRIGARFDAYFTSYRDIFFDFDIDRYGARLELTRPIYWELYFLLAAGYEKLELSDFEDGSDNRELTIPSYEVALVLDSRDWKPYPLSGWYFRAAASGEGFSVPAADKDEFGMDPEFVKYSFSARRYQPVLDDKTLVIGAEAKFLRDGPPSYAVIHVGGEKDVRGLDFGESPDVSDSAAVSNFGDQNVLYGTIEYRSPIVMLRDADDSSVWGMAASGFVDAGGTWFGDIISDDFTPTVSYGIGLHFFLVGFEGFRVEYAWTADGEDSWVVDFRMKM
jgi:outer membrane protein assembly factor BamA